MAVAIRYIFGCKHGKRNNKSVTYFENGLEIPVAYCDECCNICNICLSKTKTTLYEKLDLCEKCLIKVKKLM